MSQPNIVFICSDQHRCDTIGSYGNTICQTPNLDRLSQQGMQFDRCYTCNPVCSPARATILTGLCNRRNSVLRNGISLPQNLPTLAGVLQDNGYRTASIGKLHVTPHCEGVPEAPFCGFSHHEFSEDNKIGPYLDWAFENYPDYEDYLIGTLFNLPTNEAYWAGKRDLRKEVLEARKRSVDPLAVSERCNWGYGHYCPLPPEAHQTYWITERAIAMLKDFDRETPFFLWVGYQDPHNPFDAPEPYRKLYEDVEVPPPAGLEVDYSSIPPHVKSLRDFLDFNTDDWIDLKRLYYAGISFMDEQIGRIIEYLQQNFNMENTLIIYHSDHGEILGDCGICGKWGYHYDSATRVPLIVRWDSHVPADTRHEGIVTQMDLMPTLLHAADITTDFHMDGKSYVPVLNGSSQESIRDYACIESYGLGPSECAPDYSSWPRTIRTKQWRMTFYADAKMGELYNTQEDPDQLNNLWFDPAHRETKQDLQKILLNHLIARDYPLAKQEYSV